MTRTVYVARRPCGCLQGFAVTGTPSQDKDASKYVARWIRDGFPVDRLELTDDAQIAANRCEEHTSHD